VAERLIVPDWMREIEMKPPQVRRRGAFFEKTLSRVHGLRRWFFDEGKNAGSGRLLRSIDPAARMGGVFFLLIGTALAGTWAGLMAATLSLCLAVALTGVSARLLLKRTAPIFIFTAIVTLPLFLEGPALDTITQGGGAGVSLFHASLTSAGFTRGGFFLARSTLMASIVVFLGLCLTRGEFMSGLSKFPLPGLFTTIIFITLANISRLLGVLEDSVLARRSRAIGYGGVREMEGWFASRARHLMERAMSTSDEVAMAMTSRGFNGRLRLMRRGFFKSRDYLFMGISGFVSILAMLL